MENRIFFTVNLSTEFFKEVKQIYRLTPPYIKLKKNGKLQVYYLFFQEVEVKSNQIKIEIPSLFWKSFRGNKVRFSY